MAIHVIISGTPIIPSSSIVTGVDKPAEQDYIVGHGFGRLYESGLKGEAVALKVLYKSDDNAVSPKCHPYHATFYFAFRWRFVARF